MSWKVLNETDDSTRLKLIIASKELVAKGLKDKQISKYEPSLKDEIDCAGAIQNIIKTTKKNDYGIITNAWKKVANETGVLYRLEDTRDYQYVLTVYGSVNETKKQTTTTIKVYTDGRWYLYGAIFFLFLLFGSVFHDFCNNDAMAFF